MTIEKHARYKKFTLYDAVKNDCGLHENDMAFVIFNNDYLLRGHAFHFVTPAEFGMGWNYYGKLEAKTIKEKYDNIAKISCPYMKKKDMEKNFCYQCSQTELNRYNNCLSIMDDSILNSYASAVSWALEEILKKPRFSKTKQFRDNRKVKMFIGLCDNKILVKGQLMNDGNTYNIVTAYVPDAYKHGNNLFYMIEETVSEIEKRHKNGKPFLCKDDNWIIL
jgi:hypothetical protein